MIEDRLRALAADAFPATPDLAASWAPNSVAITEIGAHGARRSRRWLLAALVALFVPATALAVRALWPEHITIVRVETLPAIAPTQAPDLGEQVATIAEASARAGFPVQALPGEESVYVLGDIVTLTYPDVVVTETPARGERDVLVKRAGPGTRVERVPGGYFLSGAPHIVSYLAPDGSYQELPPRLAGNTLAIERDQLVIRIEGKDLTRTTALRLSRQLAAP